jgi:hypothetical protein
MKRVLLAVMVVLLCLVTLVTAAKADTEQKAEVLNAINDNTLIESPTGALSNGTGSSFFVGRTNQPTNSIRRSLIAFDIAGKIPACSTVKSVKLRLSLERTAASSQPIELHRVLKNWGEGSSRSQGGKGEPAAKGDATWIHTFYDTDTWANPGGDFSTTVSAVQTVSGMDTYTWGSTSEMVADVQAWLDSPKENFGWLLLGNEAAPKTAKRFASRHNADTSAQPQLRVNFLQKSSC